MILLNLVLLTRLASRAPAVVETGLEPLPELRLLYGEDNSHVPDLPILYVHMPMTTLR